MDFGELVRAHQSMVFSLAYHFLHDRDLAEEVAQEVFLSLHRNLARIQSAEHAGFWLRKVAVQRAIDETRRRKRRPQVALEAGGGAVGERGAGGSVIERGVAAADCDAGRRASRGGDFAVPGGPRSGRDRGHPGDAAGHGEKPFATFAGAASGEAGAARLGRNLMDLEEQLKGALARKAAPDGFAERVAGSRARPGR